MNAARTYYKRETGKDCISGNLWADYQKDEDLDFDNDFDLVVCPCFTDEHIYYDLTINQEIAILDPDYIAFLESELEKYLDLK